MSEPDPDPRPHVVIVGGGFAGLYAARALRKAPVRLTVVDRRNHHLFQPLLYQVATAALAAPDVAAPIRKILRKQRNATVLLGEVVDIDVENRRLVLADGELHYDALVLATGAENNFFGHDEWEEHAPGLKSIEDAFEIRHRVLLAYEAAEREPDPEKRRRLLTFAVIGGGPTGVELAGAIQEIARRTLSRDFRNFDPRETRVVLLDSGARLLQEFPEALSLRAEQMLRKLGVEVRTNSAVKDVDEDGVQLDDGRVEAATTLWAAGVKPSPLAGCLGAPLEKGAVRVSPDLSVPGHPEVFVAGDLAWLEQDGQRVPGVAPAAIQMGRHAARMIRADLAGEPRSDFRYADRGSLATIGRKLAVARIGRLQLAGWHAWLLWLVVHVAWLVGFRNRVVVILDWAWAYITYQRSARVILRRDA